MKLWRRNGHRDNQASDQDGRAAAVAALRSYTVTPGYYSGTFALGTSEAPRAQPELRTVDEVMRGVRQMTIVADANWSPVLVGGYGQHWTSGTMQAKCLNVGSIAPDLLEAVQFATAEAHLAQDEDDCGIYMMPPDEKALEVGSYYPEEHRHTVVLVDCVGWGVVVDGSRGRRCQFARIERIKTVLPPHVRAMLAERYDCEVVSGDGVLSEARDDGGDHHRLGEPVHQEDR